MSEDTDAPGAELLEQGPSPAALAGLESTAAPVAAATAAATAVRPRRAQLPALTLSRPLTAAKVADAVPVALGW
jgi:hypothetical protein